MSFVVPQSAPPIAPASIGGSTGSTDNAALRADGTGAATLQNSLLVIDDSGYISSFGGQITFPATQAASAGANTLDDYEEGTFTPSITFGGAAVGVTYTTQTGNYTKIGNRVLLNLNLRLSNKGSSTGAVQITGFPISITNGSLFPEYVAGLTLAGTAGYVSFDMYTTVGDAYIYGPSGTTGSLSDTNCTNSTWFVMRGESVV